MKKLLNIPDRVHDILIEHKKLTGRSVSGMITEALFKWLVHEKLFIPIRVRLYYDEKLDEYFTEEDYERIKNNCGVKKIEIPPQAVVYCDSDKCSVVGLDDKA